MRPKRYIKSFAKLFFIAGITCVIAVQNIYAQVNENIQSVEEAFNLLDQVIKADKFITRLDSLYTIDLPVGIGAKDSVNAENYTIVIHQLMVEDGLTYIDAYMAFKIPGTTKKVAFAGKEIPISFNGGIFDEAKLFLVSDFNVPLTKNIDLILRGKGQTSVTIDCFGFKEMDLFADVLFDSTMFVSENPDGTIKNEQLTTSFRTTITNWNNLLVGVSLKPFQLKALKGVGFSVNSAVLDLSDFTNPSGIAFGEAYQNGYFIDGNQKLWQGIYIRDVQVRLPPQFRKKNSKEIQADSVLMVQDSTYVPSDSVYKGRTTFYSQNIIIDELGFTGMLGASKLMTLDEGDMQGWDFSVENFLIDIQSNELVAGQFSGQIRIPKMKMQEVFDYNAVIGLNGTYAFTAGITERMKLPMFAADLYLEPNSQITIAVKEKTFAPALYLNGEMKIKAPTDKTDTSSAKLALANIPFKGMRIQTEKPYFSVEELSYGTDQNMFSKFPVTIRKVGIESDSNRFGMELGLSVNFTGPGDGGFGGEGDFTIWAKEENNDWKYDGVEVDRISVEILKGDTSMYLFGEVMFMRGDEIYGNGFRGKLEAKFSNFGLGATAVFGNVNDMRYWFADASLTSESGIKMGLISLYGFTGGAYYHVSPMVGTGNKASRFGESQSGIVYVPDSYKGLQLRAGVDFGLTGKKGVANGDVEFGIDFFPTGGVDRVYFSGNAYFMSNPVKPDKAVLLDRAKKILEKTTELTKLEIDDDRAAIWGSIFMEYAFRDKTFNANFDIKANVAGGVIRGVAPDYTAGWGAIHLSPDEWYIHIGSPDNPNGIKVLGLATLTNYFMVGKRIPELPLPSQEVMDILHTSPSDYQKLANTPELASGTGLALGGAFKFDTGEQTFLMFYGRFGCGIGFDILLKNYGNATCDGSTEAIGINGWYAQGQAYAWVLASLGIKVDLPFYSGHYNIFDLQTASLLQTKGPNPFWMQGEVEGEYNILGGLVKGHCEFEFEIGEKCKITTSSPFGGTPIIAEISPSDNETDVSVFSTPQVVFNMPVGQPIEIINEEHEKKVYRIKLNSFYVAEAGGPELAVNMFWNDEQNVLALKPREVLPGKRKIKVYAEVGFEELIKGVWYTIDNGDGTRESMEVTFISGARPKYIPQENVTYSYPAYRSFNYYQKESSENYIQLGSGQEYLFTPGKEWVQKAKITSLSGGEARYTSFRYDAGNMRVSFALPQDLVNNTIYRFELVNIPSGNASAVDENIKKVATGIELEKAEGTDMTVTTQQAEGIRNELQEKEIYTMEFRTSSTNTFAEKIETLRKSNGVSWELYPLVHSLTVNILGERFDEYEVENLVTGKAVSCELNLVQTAWYNTYMLPIIGLTPSNLASIDAEPFDPGPLVTYFFQSDGTRNLTQEEIDAGYTRDVEVLSGMKYYLAKAVCEYHAYLKGQIANYGGGNIPIDKKNKILNTTFIPLRYGDYPVKINYTLPGKEEPLKTMDYVIDYND